METLDTSCLYVVLCFAKDITGPCMSCSSGGNLFCCICYAVTVIIGFCCLPRGDICQLEIVSDCHSYHK
jgi:hypothetical protein